MPSIESSFIYLYVTSNINIYTIHMHKYSFILLTFIIFFDTIIQTPKEVEYEKKNINV